MKIKVKEMSYEDVLALPKEKRFSPIRPSILFRSLLKAVSAGELKDVGFTFTENGMEKLKDGEPCLILMNHSAFIDLKIAVTYFFPRPMNIVCTSDGFVGKKWLMRQLGCIPTRKFVTDLGLVRDIAYSVKKLRCSVLMYPEASYSFDGTATPIPPTVAKLAKSLGIPVVFVKTKGAFLRDPLYNGLRLRDVRVSADIEYLLSPSDLETMTADEIDRVLTDRFSFDNFKDQAEEGVKVSEPFRAEGLERVLYKCPNCGAEGRTVGHGTVLVCENCDKRYELDEFGKMKALEGECEFSHIPDWYEWERKCVREEILRGDYLLDIPVDICIMKGMKALYRVGSGRLRHGSDGFLLTGCNGKLEYSQKPRASYSLYADYFWYEIGDMVCIGNGEMLYYCFPKDGSNIAAKTRLAAEELYKLSLGDARR